MKKLVFLMLILGLALAAEANPMVRVLGGTEAGRDSSPYMVVLKADRYRCAGIIVNRRYVVTTSACVPNKNFFVLTGVHDISGPDYDQRLPVDQIIKHPTDDIALIRLGYAIFFNDVTAPARLPVRGFLPTGDVTLFGWGSSSRSYSVKNEAILDVIDYDRCQMIFGGPGASPLNKRNMCTGPLSGGIAPCTGDAGSPIVQNNTKGEPEVVALVSWGFIPCGGANNPQVHILLSEYIDWLFENLG